jgi:hypothetical protein
LSNSAGSGRRKQTTRSSAWHYGQVAKKPVKRREDQSSLVVVGDNLAAGVRFIGAHAADCQPNIRKKFKKLLLTLCCGPPDRSRARQQRVHFQPARRLRRRAFRQAVMQPMASSD